MQCSNMRSSRCLARSQVTHSTLLRKPNLVCRSAAQDANTTRTLQIPLRAQEQVPQAVSAIESAWKAGVKRQRIELLLPLIGATDLDDFSACVVKRGKRGRRGPNGGQDWRAYVTELVMKHFKAWLMWPGGIRQQFKAIQPLVESILRQVKQVEGLEGGLQPELWDDGDAVACYKSSNLAVVIFPTASVVDKLRKLTEGPDAPKLLVIVNPQWEGKGNLISDFGIGPWRRAKEEFVATFNTTYWLRQQRVYGDIVRVLYGYPGLWQIHAQAPGGDNTCIATQATLPTYQQIEDLLRSRPDSSINKSVAERLQAEFEFNRKSLDQKL